ncbi:unnamed protein product [Pieris macdunnoughi]|uniref:Uncharacterized protein n=1 Tax=Pieris macdunnoughi TaxID=345717 RepID=A0A821N5A3_9NEOP|nr:unnamed protein product [Pieris macdunnoughi]
MASNKYNSLQGLRGYRMVELAQRSVDKSSRQSQPETKCSIRKPKLEKENRPIIGNNNNTCLPITKSKSNTQTGTDSSQNILRLSHDSLSIMVDDPELVEIISSLKDNESGIHCEVDNENFNKKTVHQSFKHSLKTLQEIEFMEQNENKPVSSLVIEENETMETKTTQTQVQLSLLPDTNTTENDYVSDNSMSILIGTSELHNLIDNLDEDPSHIILDPKSIPVSIPANENELTSNNNATAEVYTMKK